MKLTNQIDFQNVEGLYRALKTERPLTERFSLEISERDAANGIYCAVRAEVEDRGFKFNPDQDTLDHIMNAAKWLTNSKATPGLLLCGLYGNGKTTLAKAISRLIAYITNREYGYSKSLLMTIHSAKDICSMCVAGEKFKQQYDDYRRLFNEPMLIIDDLGEEPKEVMVYGMIHTPIIDLISARYASRLMTIITTNLDAEEIRAKYDERVYDRLCEMMTSIIFKNESYRRKR